MPKNKPDFQKSFIYQVLTSVIYYFPILQSVFSEMAWSPCSRNTRVRWLLSARLAAHPESRPRAAGMFSRVGIRPDAQLGPLSFGAFIAFASFVTLIFLLSLTA